MTKKNIIQSYLKCKEYFDRKAKAAPLNINESCLQLQPNADHQGSKNPFRKFRWIGPNIVEKGLPNKNYVIMSSENPTQTKRKICIGFGFTNMSQIRPWDVRPEGNLQPDDEVIISQVDLYVITWETDFGEFTDLSYNKPETILRTNTDTSGDTINTPDSQDQIFTDADLWSTGPRLTNNWDPHTSTSSDSKASPDDQITWRGPESLDNETEYDCVIEIKNPRWGKYNLRPNPTTNFTDEYKY